MGDREQQEAADQKSKNPAARAAARQPVVHQDDPSDADHRAEAEREVLDGAQAPVEGRLRRDPRGSHSLMHYTGNRRGNVLGTGAAGARNCGRVLGTDAATCLVLTVQGVWTCRWSVLGPAAVDSSGDLNASTLERQFPARWSVSAQHAGASVRSTLKRRFGARWSVSSDHGPA